MTMMRPEIRLDLRDFQQWNPTVAGVRDAIFEQRIVAMGIDSNAMEPEAAYFLPTEREVDTIWNGCHDAVRAGRFFEFGDLPNDVIKQGGLRGSALWDEQAIGVPFTEPWMFMHSWERSVAVYLVHSVDGTSFGGRVEVCELQPNIASGERVLVIGDRAVLLSPDPENPTAKYHAQAAAAPWRFFKGLGDEANKGMTPLAGAAANVLDPLMTVLLILNMRNTDRETVPAPHKLNKHRRRAGKPLIPPYERINTAPYVTAIQTRGTRSVRGEPQGGTHASPIPHIRQGHWRNYETGKRSFIQDTMINVSEETRSAFKANRSHYTVRP